MFTKEQLQGILLSLAKTEITIQRQESRDVGFAVRLAVHFRANNIEFVEALHRTLLQYQIESNLRPVIVSNFKLNPELKNNPMKYKNEISQLYRDLTLERMIK